MEWRALEEHYRAATIQDPAPFGEDAIEWDYSRYSRALGLTGQPGLDDLDHTGCALLVLPTRRWEAAARKYEGWAGQQDWSLVRLSARPTVMVPDPVVHGLGVAVAGHEGLILARSGRQGSPALGARPRPAGMSIPLTPGERWLIATAHVRRRLRNEIAVRGLVLFVEEAEKLTPAALSLLAHLVRAHRAWQARMLARDAKAYVVFVTTPEHKAEMLAMFDRFDIQGPVPVRRDRIRKDAPSSPPSPHLNVEEEHLFSALAAAPLALTEPDITAVFGTSATAIANRLAERDILRTRVESGERCFVPNPAQLDGLADPPPRVLHALLDRYRQRLEHGHQHLRFAIAALAARLGQPLRAAAHINRASPADAATIPFDAYMELQPALASVKEELHVSHLGAWIAMHAHQRYYDRARSVATDLTQRNIRTAREFHRTLLQILCMGRTHTDQAIPPDFWPGLKSRTLDASLVDAVCIFAELFARLRMMKPAEILQRYEIAEECWGGSSSSVRCRSLIHLVEMIRYRVAVSLKAHFYAHLPLPCFCGNSITPRRLAFEYQIPAYVTATLAYAETVGRNHSDVPNFDRRDRSMGVDLVRCTGNPYDARIQLGGWYGQLRIRGCGLIVRELVDESLLLLAPNSPQQQRHALCVQLQGMAGGRAWLLGANNLLRNGAQREGPLAASKLEVVYASQALLYAGDFAGARDVLRAQMDGDATQSHNAALLIHAHVLAARKTLKWDEFAFVSQLVVQHRSHLSDSQLKFTQLFVRGSELLSRGDFREAESCFSSARSCLGRLVPGDVGALYVSALRSELSTKYLRRTVDVLADQKKPDVQTVFSRLLSYHRMNGGFAYEATSVGAILDYVAVYLESWARLVDRKHAQSSITLALFLRRAIDPALRSVSDDIVCALARVAPTFFRVLRSQLLDTVGQLIPSAPSTRSLASALGVIETLWSDTEAGRECAGLTPDALCTHDVRVVPSHSRLRHARQHIRCWQEDAAIYARALRATMEDPLSSRQRIEAFGYLFGGSPVPTRVLVDLRVCRRRMGACVVRLQPLRSRVGVHEDVSSRTVGRAPLMARPGSLENGAKEVRFEGGSRAATQVREMIQVAASCDYPVLVVGETGVGKEVVAQCIHALSARGRHELVVADCAATTESLLESELFGHKRGAFTGAELDHIGFVEKAHGSTLFLDEVDSMSPRMQASLLRVLESGEYRPVGDNAHRRSDFRLVAAAMPRLMDLVETQQFRQDLFYRLSALRIHIPALAEREGDAAEIARSYAADLGCVVSPDALGEVDNYAWPGNVRQLRHCIDVASLSACDGHIDAIAVVQAIDAYRGSTENTSVANSRDAAGATLIRASRALMGLPYFGAWEFARAAGVSRRSAQRHLARLLRLGHLVRLGAGRATRYKIRARPQSF